MTTRAADKFRTRRAAGGLAPSSLDRQARTVEAVAATQNPVNVGGFAERLRIDPSSVDLEQFVGGPVLNGHRAGGFEDQVGVIESARIANGELIVRIKIFRGAAGDDLLDKIEDGLSGVSVGFKIINFEDDFDGEQNIRTITNWRPIELSIAPIPADPGARIRSFSSLAEALDAEEAGDDPMTNDSERKTTMPTKTSPAKATADDTARQANTAEIKTLCTRFRMEEAFTDDLIKRGVSIPDAKLAILEKRAEIDERTVGHTQITLIDDATTDNPAFRRRAMGAALYQQMSPSAKVPQEAEAYRGFAFVELARESLDRAGWMTRAMRPAAIIRAALGLSAGNYATRAGAAFGAMGTGDFTAAVGDAARMFLLERYRIAEPALKTAASERTFTDYREHTFVRGSGFPELKKVNEHGEITHGTLADSGEKISLVRYGRIVGLTHQLLTNDSVGMFADLMTNAAEGALATEAGLLAAAVEANNLMADGLAVFAAGHNNLAATGAAPTETTLSTARSAMRTQTGINGERISPTPRFIVVPPQLETTAEKLISTVQATKTADVNPFTTLSPIVEPRLTNATAWYLSADPAQSAGLVFGYLDAEGGPVVDERPGWEIDGLEIRVRMSFAAGFVDHRAWFKNPGV